MMRMYGYGQAAQVGNPYGGYTQWQSGAAQSYMDRLNALQGQTPPAQSSAPQLIRVTGIDGARAYQMPPNASVPLFDGGEDLLYVKTTDGAGFPTIRTFAITPISDAAPAANGAEYVTRAEFDKLREEVKAYGQQSVRGRPKPVPADNADGQ
nr:MAG TPA: hypothetical protein [Caudoviricetes sp.]